MALAGSTRPLYTEHSIEHLLTIYSQLLDNLSNTTFQYPPWLQYRNISQFARPSSVSDNGNSFYLVTRLQAEVLQTKFLLLRLKVKSSSQARNQTLFDTAHELLAVTLSLWLDRDRLFRFQSAFHWMVCIYLNFSEFFH